ncbi:hypothetical protein QJS04_geneDACA020215 [Acorus gramineus]|uniref:Uncharacterized protein n=1 Tax=Acorus gramineus TaxID=55184 RepID=A0AAV9BLS0_ACOGR|nr:hypothetical protein QJS04_geneDACA020215 [Acorus gramineus]
MNFLMRAATPAVPLPDPPTVPDPNADMMPVHGPATTLQGLIADDPYPVPSLVEDGNGENDGGGAVTGDAPGLAAKNQIPVRNHTDVPEDEGLIIIPCKELPENWSDSADMLSFRSLDRSFVFPGEQIHILACLSTSKEDADVITPFRVAAMMSRNGSTQNIRQPNGVVGTDSSFTQDNGMNQASDLQDVVENGETILTTDNTDPKHDISSSETFIRMEDYRKRTERLLERFMNSHFYVRIAEAEEPLWSKRNVAEPSSSDITGEKIPPSNRGSRMTTRKGNLLHAIIDKGSFDGSGSGGVARNIVKCCSLPSGDIVVLLQVIFGISDVKDPVLEILQFEKHNNNSSAPEKSDNLYVPKQDDPCGELLKWLLPVDRSLPPPRPLSPPHLSSSSVIGTHRSTLSASSGSQLFSFGNLRSYSMSSLPQSGSASAPAASPPSSTNQSFELEDFDRFSQKQPKAQEVGTEGLLSFRGVTLEPERFSTHCGLEGIYIPGRRWRRKLEIVEPLEIHSFAANCNTDDLLCVQIKNVTPVHLPDIVIFLDAITIVFEEAPKGGSPLTLPISCIETGDGHALPNLALRRGEEHSFILKPATSLWKDFKVHGTRSYLPTQLRMGNTESNMHVIPKVSEGISSASGQYAVLVSCRCNYTESRLFFKQPTSWQPRVARDLMISVASKISEQTAETNGKVSQLPVQVLTLKASNLTSENLTLTVLAPASLVAPPSVVPLNSAPETPVSPFVGFPEFMGRVDKDRLGPAVQSLSSLPTVGESQKESSDTGTRSISLTDRTISTTDIVSSADLGCTHLWLQSAVPLGCIPSQSSATAKLELLPLTDGIIALDTLQIAVKEKGLTYVPEQSLKIHATSSITTGIS